jgi:hypothetical protein
MALAQRLKSSYLLHMRSSAVLVLTLLAGACSSDEPAPAAIDPVRDSGAAGGQGNGSDGGTVPDASVDAAPSDASTLPDAAPDAGPGPNPVETDAGPDASNTVEACAIPAGAGQIVAPEPSAALCQGKQWDTVEKVFYLEQLADESFRSVTPDELAIAWFAPEADGGSDLVIHYSSRVDIVDPFNPIRTIPPGAYANEGLALSADGLNLVVVLSDRSGFTQYSRNSRDEPFFDEPSDVQFLLHRFDGTFFDFTVADPVFSSDGLTFYYSRVPDDVAQASYNTHSTIFSSTREPGASWPDATPVLGDAIAAHCEKRRRVTGISSDGLTLFYWDEFSDTQRAAFRETSDDPFDTAIDLGDRPGAQPNADCTHLYYSGPTDGSDTDLVVAE